MSADDFQTKYASVMESMLKNAVAETTKLFETMVDELKAEISRTKKENEDLKSRCGQLERARTQTAVNTRESDHNPRQSDVLEKRDIAVQCDLVTFRTTLVEQCQPLRQSSLQIQHRYEEMVYALQEHDYETRREDDSQMAFIPVKQEEDESPVLCKQVLSNKADSPKASPCGIENQGPFIKMVYSTREISMPHRYEETQVALVPPFLERNSALQGDQSQSPEPRHLLAIAPAAIKDDMEEESEISLEVSEVCTQEELETHEKHQLLNGQQQSEVVPFVQTSMVPQQCQNNDEMSLNEQNDANLQYAEVQPMHNQLAQPTPLINRETCKEKKSGVPEAEATSQSDMVRRRKGRPPKKAKPLQRPVKETLHSLSSDIPQVQEEKKSPTGRVEEVEVSSAVDKITSFKSLTTCPDQESTIITPLIQQKVNTALKDAVNSVVISQSPLLASQQLFMNVEEGAVQAPSTEVACAIKSLQAPSVELQECCSSVELKDAMLLVEAMNQSVVQHLFSCPQNMAAAIQIDEAQVKLQTPPHVETYKAIDYLSTKEISATTQSATEELGTLPNNEAQALIKVVMPKQQDSTFSLCQNTSTSSKPQSTQTNVQALHQNHQATCVASSRRGTALPQKIIVVPRSASSLMRRKIAVESPAKPFSSSKAAGLSLGRPSLASVPQETISSISLPVVTLLTTTSKGLQSGTRLHSKVSIIPRQVSAVVSRKHQSQATVLPAQQDSTQSTAPVIAMVSQTKLMPSLPEFSVSVETQTALDEVATVSSLKRDKTFDNFKSPEKTTSVSEATNTHAETESTKPMFPAVPPAEPRWTIKQKLSAVVKLNRLLFPISTKGDMQETSFDVMSKHPSQQFDIPPSLGETAVRMSKNTSRMSEESNYITAKAAFENFNLEELPKPEQEPVAVSGTACELTSVLDEETISIAAQEYVLPKDQLIKEKQLAAPKYLTSITSKDQSDPHLQETNTQLLAELAVSPLPQDPEKIASDDSPNARACPAGTTPSDKNNSLMEQLRRLMKTHLRNRKIEENPESCIEAQTVMDDHLNDANTTSECIPLIPQNPGAVYEDVTSSINATDNLTPICPKTSRLCSDGVTPKKTASESSSVSSRMFKPTSESTPLSPRRTCLGRDDVGSKIKISTSVSARRCCSTKENTTPKTRRNMSVHDKTSSSGDHDSPKTTYMRPKRTNSRRDGATPKRTKSNSTSPRISTLNKSDSPRMYPNELTSVIRRKCTFAKDGPSTKRIKMECNPRSGSTTVEGGNIKNAMDETDSPIVRGPKLAKDGTSPRKIVESSSVKKPRFKDGTNPEINLRALNAKKCTKAAKANTIARIKFQNGTKTCKSAETRASGGAGKKCTTKAVWIPPIVSISKTPTATGKRSVHLPVKTETIPPKIEDHPVVYPPSVSLYPIPVKAPPVVSPSQPLSVIGRRLLKNQCGECGCVLNSSAALESHVICHTGQRPFSCTLCGKCFTDSKGLKRHGRVHRNGRIHVCQQCGKGFVYRFSLTKHLQMVHTRIKPFVCQICNKGYYTKLDVEAHIRSHTGEKPFHCNLCEKKFTRRALLNVHLRWHNGEKRHWCPFCGKGFLDINNLKRHKYIHTGEKPHSCPHCPKHFKQSGHLKKHVRNVHKIQ